MQRRTSSSKGRFEEITQREDADVQRELLSVATVHSSCAHLDFGDDQVGELGTPADKSWTDANHRLSLGGRIFVSFGLRRCLQFEEL